ncbi:MAG: toxin-antitoxin system YwqK family antitoxin [Cyclobacteriaceae bacterium]
MISLTLRSQSIEHSTFYDSAKTQLKEVISINPEDNTLDGLYQSYYQTGRPMAQGYYHSNTPDSTWTYFYENGNIKAEGNLKNGKQSGVWTFNFENGHIKSEGTLLDGIKEGPWTNYFEGGAIKNSGNYKQNEKFGIWNYYFEDNSVKAQSFHEAGKGQYTEYFPSGKVKMEGNNVNEKSEGVWRYYYENGSLQAEGSYLAGQRDGKWVFYHENGAKSSEGLYTKGKQRGDWKYYHPNGNISAQGNLENDKRDGPWQLFFSSGGLKQESTYKNGLGNSTEYYPSGKIYAKGQLSNGQKEGKWKYFSEDGEQDGEAEFTGGIGQYKGFYKNGNVKMSGILENNKRIGEWTLYDRKGKIEGTYRPIYEEEKPVFRLNDQPDRLKDGQNSAIPAYMFKNRSNRFFDERINEYQGITTTTSPFWFGLGELPINVELYYQERLGHEIQYYYIRDPFFQANQDIDLYTPYLRGHRLKFRQKLYGRDHSFGMPYFGHAMTFEWLSHQINGKDQTVLPFEDIKIQNIERVIAYGVFLGWKWMEDAGSSGFVLDSYIGVDFGYRNIEKKYEPSEELDGYFAGINQNSFYMPFVFGLNIGFASQKLKKKKGRFDN